MTGMEMMLKSLGFDPAAVKEMANGIITEFKTMRETLQRVESNQTRILEILENGSYQHSQGHRSLEPETFQGQGEGGSGIGQEQD